MPPVPSAPQPPGAAGEAAGLSPLGRETRLLAPALAKLRQARDPVGALAHLRSYREAFPAGLLGREADVATVEALLLLDRGAEALAILDRLVFEGTARDRELRLARAELRSRTDCARALDDFAVLLGADGEGRTALLPSPVDERALFGRATCKARLGQADAPAAFRAYLQRYPAGRFASEARRYLEDAR